jgi:AGCS family alanine or glycine:cation symporter
MGKKSNITHQCLKELNKQKKFGESKFTTRTFQIIYCLFIIIGSAMNLKSVVNLSDAFTLFLAVPNLIAVFLLSDIIMKELKRYCKKYNVGFFKNEQNN